jgi:hypothetical protein
MKVQTYINVMATEADSQIVIYSFLFLEETER